MGSGVLRSSLLGSTYRFQPSPLFSAIEVVVAVQATNMLLYVIAALVVLSILRKLVFSSPVVASPESRAKIQALIKDKPIFIASKTYCPYCTRTKDTVSSITNEAYVLELNTLSDGKELQAALLEITGQKTVPNVFIGGEHIGGNSHLQELHAQGGLEPKIEAALSHK